jgi:hypothetical protein
MVSQRACTYCRRSQKSDRNREFFHISFPFFLPINPAAHPNQNGLWDLKRFEDFRLSEQAGEALSCSLSGRWLIVGPVWADRWLNSETRCSLIAPGLGWGGTEGELEREFFD